MKKIIKGTLTKPRLYIFKSNKHLYAQVIDDLNNNILASSSSISKDIKKFANCKIAQVIGKQIAYKIKQKGVTEVVFDRGKNIYHGQIKTLADATRKAGIIF